MATLGPSAKYFEDFAAGDEFVTQGRTIGEADNTIWTMFSGDMNPMHVDDEYARENGLFGGRFPAGMMVVAVASGLQERLGLFTGTGLAMISQTIDYHKAVLLNDTIRERMIVEECVPSTSRPAGRVTFRYEIIRQNDDICVSGLVTYYLLGRDGSGA
jgi:acyl dehydratase